MAWTTPGTAVAGDVLTAAFWNQQVRDNMIELAPFFSAWTAYTPVLTQNGTRTTTIVNARYMTIGKTVRVMVNLNITQAGTAGQVIVVSLPVNMTSRITSADHVVGSFSYLRVTAGVRYSGATVIVPGIGNGSVLFQPNAVSNVLGADPSFAIANGDYISFDAYYESA